MVDIEAESLLFPSAAGVGRSDMLAEKRFFDPTEPYRSELKSAAAADADGGGGCEVEGGG